MRTAFFVMVLFVLAVAAGGSFVVRGQEAVATATLERRCDPPTLPSGVDTLVQCKITARNTGTTMLPNALLSIAAMPNLAIPDAYYFFRVTRDGVDQPLNEGTLGYAYGDLAPGASSTLALDVIVRATQAYGAQAQLQAGGSGDLLASVPLGADVTAAPPPPLAVTLALRGGPLGPAPPVFDLRVRNDSGAAMTGVRIDLAVDKTAALAPAAGWTAGAAPGHMTFSLGDLAPGKSIEQTLTFVSNGEPCPFIHPAVVVTGEGGARLLTAAAIANGSGTVGSCTGQGGGQAGGGDATNGGSQFLLPSTGSGRMHGDSRGRTALVGLAVGLLLVAAGLSVRRTHRR
ncbi:MAG: hypothetical protein IVW36_09690 [Dehalococcoidia bacterium]|nr:hypothetical protein [Dehalococcoidia bacterium]